MSERIHHGVSADPAGDRRRQTPRTDARVLRLQRRIGNRALQRLLQRDSDDFAAVTDLSKGRFGNWTSRPAGATDAELFEDLVLTAGADTISSVAATWGAVSRIGSLDDAKPGLNYMAKLGVPATTGYIDGAGRFTAALPTGGADPPRVAIVLGPEAFARDRAYALSTLRHEMRHAVHFEKAITRLKGWRESGSHKDFGTWIASQRMSAVESTLVNERIAGTRSNTETLAWMEGVITGLPFLPPSPGLDAVSPNYPPAIAELLGCGRFYLDAGTAGAVKTAALDQLRGYCCGSLTAPQRQAFVAWVAFLQERAQGAPPARTKPTDAQRAADRVFNDFHLLQAFLADVLAALKTPCPQTSRRAQALGAKLAKGQDIAPDLHSLGDAELHEVDAAAARDAKGRTLREKVAAELFARHRPPAAQPHGLITVKRAGKVERTDAVDGGEVESQTGVEVTAPGGNSSTEAFSFTYRPKRAMADERWLQLTWREFYTELPAAHRAGKPQKDRRSGLLEWSGFPYQFTTDPDNPHWNTDSPSKGDAFNEEIRDRTASELTMFDWPSSDVSELAPLFADPGKHPVKGVSHFHQDVFLVRGGDVIYHAAVDEQWEISSATAPPSLTVVVHAPLPNRLTPAQRERLSSQYPQIDYLRDF